MQYISTFSIGGYMAAITLCILSVVSRHVMYLIKSTWILFQFLFLMEKSIL